MSEEFSLIQIGDDLNAEQIQKLASLLKIPSGLYENVTKGNEFLYKLRKWGRHDPYIFYQGLNSIGRADLCEIAINVRWLASDHPLEGFEGLEPEELSMKTFVKVFKFEFTREDWFRMGIIIPELDADKTFEDKVKMLMQEGYISKDLNVLIRLMSQIKRNDIGTTFKQYHAVFFNIPEPVFKSKFRKEISLLEKEITTWERSLRIFMELQNKQVKQMLDDDKPTDIESVYVDLTIIEERPRPVDPEDETTYNEIAFLRKIANKEINIRGVDFTNIIKNYSPIKKKWSKENKEWEIIGYLPEIWCLIGNPGCGKSFLCHRTALRFGKGELPQFSFCVSIPCRNHDWHEMEKSRDKIGNIIEGEFIQRWLRLSMPVGPSWTVDLSKHLVESDGHDLLIIMDGLDEFLKEVPFQQTLLFLLLTRKALTQSTIIVTSRPGAYTKISQEHTLNIDRFFQVLGFSPKNRDRYFQIQLPQVEKHNQLKELLHLHDEINQLSLIPVNASLFAALVRGSDNITAHTLTNLYSELIAYLIRRQLNRMGLEHMSAKSLFTLDPNVQECLFTIGELAYLGIYSRELICTKDILLTVDKEEKSCQCLGLAEEHIRKDHLGRIMRVWSFAHLTIQEFIGAFWLFSCSWRDQCLSTRYVVNTEDTFVMFKMNFRFLCGLLSNSARNVLSILYRHLPTLPISMENMPMKYQLKYEYSIYAEEIPMTEYLGWIEFTKTFIVISEILSECNSDSINKSYSIVRQFLPNKIYLYISSTISPNEWKCFLQTLPLLKSIQLIQFDTNYINVSQFRSLLTQLTSCSLSLLAVRLNVIKEDCYSTIRSYSDAIIDSKLRSETKISLELHHCELTDIESDYSSNKFFQIFKNICLYETELSTQSVQELSNQIISTDNLYYNPHSSDSTDYVTILKHLNKATQLNSIFLYNIPEECVKLLQSHLPLLSNLQEIGLNGDVGVPCASLLPHISTLSNLKFLCLHPGYPDTSYKEYFLQILNSNTNSLKGLELNSIQYIGLNNWSELLSSLLTCTNLVYIQLCFISPQDDDVTLWGRVMTTLRCLVYLYMLLVPLSDSALSSLCAGFIHHRNIRCIVLRRCELNANSCNILTQLIPTVTLLKKLDISFNGLSKLTPDTTNLLRQTAELYSITLECSL